MIKGRDEDERIHSRSLVIVKESSRVSKKLPMATYPIIHLLIAYGLFAIALCINQYQQTHLNTQQSNHLVPLSTRQVSQGSCPEKNGRFPVKSQCDAYIECIDGIAEEKLCPEGLVFNPDARFNYPCGYPIDVDCGDRPNRQPAQPTEDCPHQYGYFKVGDHQNCGQFMNCADGRGYVKDSTFFGGEIRFYRSTHDCQRYYICVNGHPRLLNCGEGNAFNELIDACDAAENVTGCAPEATNLISDNVQQTRLF
ncbi:hypothetical protein M0802_001816 [Mischocyttarus mexicanus]|nr:hypothetical protein M0802_001816 [Mischocyttarus mexicanus]